MSEDWKPGDLALCIKGGRLSDSPDWFSFPRGGSLYRVVCVRPDALWTTLQTHCGLVLDGAPINRDGTAVWPSFRFRKIRPHTPDAEDAETIRLLKGEKVKA